MEMRPETHPPLFVLLGGAARHNVGARDRAKKP